MPSQDEVFTVLEDAPGFVASRWQASHDGESELGCQVLDSALILCPQPSASQTSFVKLMFYMICGSPTGFFKTDRREQVPLTPVIIIGPMCAGKSTVAQYLAERLDFPRIELDEVRWTYYEEIGYDQAAVGPIMKAEGSAAWLATGNRSRRMPWNGTR